LPTITEIVDDNNGLISHIVIILDIENTECSQRFDVINPSEALQCALITMTKNQTFLPHVHPTKSGTQPVQNTQEVWVVITGKVQATLYGIGGELIKNVTLNTGDACITLRGGHNYKSLVDGTIVYEFKTGPYLGPEIDKRAISSIPLESKG
jgi:cupin fold WbuC family metalloprotein